MSEIPKVSVVIPTFNRESTIMQSVHSVLRQTYSDLELIVVDDCSSDGTAKLLSEISDPRVRVIYHHTNGGASAARNTGVRSAIGEYVAFQDSDDEWLPRKIERQLAVVEAAAGTVAVYCGMVAVDGIANDGLSPPTVRYLPAPQPGIRFDGNLKSSLLQRLIRISTQTLMVRRDILLKCHGFDESLEVLEDWDCVLRIADYGPIAFVPEPLVIQRYTANSLTCAASKWPDAMRRVLEKHRKAFAQSPRALARHYYILSGRYRRLGELSNANRFVLQSLKLNPLRLRAWIGFIRTVLGRILQRSL